MADEIHLGDIGLTFVITINDGSTNVDISTATVKQFILLKPSGEELTVNASFVTDGSDGELSYTTVLGDLDEVGFWKLQAYIEMPSGKWHSDIASFRVHRNI